MVKKVMNTATKIGINAAKSASKWVVQKTAEATGDLIGNKTADKIPSIGKSKGKNKESRRNLHSTRKNNNKLLMTLNCFEHKTRNKAVAFKNDAPFINCISKINVVKVDDTEDLDVVMPMYNLLEYSKNYRKNNRQLVELLQW